MLLSSGCVIGRALLKDSKAAHNDGAVGKKTVSVTFPEVHIDTKGVSVVTHASREITEREHVVSRNISADRVRNVIMHTDFGSITAEPSSDSSRIKVAATVTLGDNALSKAEREKYLGGFTLPDTVDGDACTARVAPPRDLPDDIGWTVSYRVSVPASVALDLKSENGEIVVRDTKTIGNVRARSEFGAITVVNAGHTVDVQTQNGSVTIKGKASRESVIAHSEFGAVSVTGPARTINAKSQNGAVKIVGAPDAETVTAWSSFGAITLEDVGGTIDAETGNGSVHYSGTPKALTLKSEFGAIAAQLYDCDALSEARLITTNGSVTLKLPASASVSLTGHTNNGGIMTNGFSGQITGNDFDKSFEATRNGGRAPIDLSTEFGNLTVTVE
jgi:hypothetical protein